ncbi:unnamed protein product [Caenorhabditis angaria]|uniref:NTF2-like domain-containing protein n=1 Tax=Caenorhabditis angaria TaxID=860376 RepID=A0A9P1IUV7_9PELO|nr:unnamed protein product [Caenorhabditis angaria]
MRILLLLTFPTFLKSSIHSESMAQSIMNEYGKSIVENDKELLFEILSESYLFTTCKGKFNREQIWDTVEFLPSLTKVLSVVRFESTGFNQNYDKNLIINLEYGNYGPATLEAKMENGKYRIIYEQQRNCPSENLYATTFLIDYKGTALKMANDLMDNWFVANNNLNKKLLLETVHIPFHLFCWVEGKNTLEITDITEETLKKKETALNWFVRRDDIEVISAEMFQNKSIGFATRSQVFYDSSFLALPFDETYKLYYQMFEKPCKFAPNQTMSENRKEYERNYLA